MTRIVLVVLAAVVALLIWLIVSSHLIISGSKIFIIIGVCLGTAVGIGITSLAWYITNKLDKE